MAYGIYEQRISLMYRSAGGPDSARDRRAKRFLIGIDYHYRSCWAPRFAVRQTVPAEGIFMLGA